MKALGKSFGMAVRYIEIDTESQNTVSGQRDTVSLKQRALSGRQNEYHMNKGNSITKAVLSEY